MAMVIVRKGHGEGIRGLQKDKRAQAYRPRDPQATSFLMSRVRGRDTRMEIQLRSALHRAGYRFRKNDRRLLGKPDIVFSRAKVAVFVDGDFWHARILKEHGITALRKSKDYNREFWVAKLRSNYERDRIVTAELKRRGWLVVRIWENDLKKRMDACLKRVTVALERRAACCNAVSITS